MYKLLQKLHCKKCIIYLCLPVSGGRRTELREGASCDWFSVVRSHTWLEKVVKEAITESKSAQNLGLFCLFALKLSIQIINFSFMDTQIPAYTATFCLAQDHRRVQYNKSWAFDIIVNLVFPTSVFG